jgi:hypothetical protein
MLDLHGVLGILGDRDVYGEARNEEPVLIQEIAR